jgi:hypothetical protein
MARRMAAAAGHVAVSQPEAGIHARAATSQRARRRWGAWQSAARARARAVWARAWMERRELAARERSARATSVEERDGWLAVNLRRLERRRTSGASQMRKERTENRSSGAWRKASVREGEAARVASVRVRPAGLVRARIMAVWWGAR